MFEAVKEALRRRGESPLDNEIRRLIRSCIADMRLVGIGVSYTDPPSDSESKKIIITPPDDPLIERAVILYCKANFGENPNSEKYRQAYEAQKISLCLAGDYNGKLE